MLQSTTAGSDSEEEKVMETYVVQRYIDKPYLVGGKKYDMRLYLLCLSYNPLTLYIYRRGFARFSSTHYQVLSIYEIYSASLPTCSSTVLRDDTGTDCENHYLQCNAPDQRGCAEKERNVQQRNRFVVNQSVEMTRSNE